MATQTQQGSEIPSTGSTLGIVGGALMMASGVVILAISMFFLPGINQFITHNMHFVTSGNTTTVVINNSTTYTITGANHWWNGTFPFQGGPIPGFVTGIIALVGVLGLISGVIVTTSAVMVRRNPSQRSLWGALVVVFSVLSFFGAGGFVIGAILGIVGGVMILTWKPSGPAAA